MEVSALKYSGAPGLQARSPLLRLQSDERLIALLRRGNTAAFEALVSRYSSRLHAFCRHLLGSREDAEDVMQEILAAAFNAILADERPINVRPWLYRIARNRCLNHLRRIQAVGVDSMDVHFSEHGASTADKVHEREEFRLLVDDIQSLPETQRTALVLREMDALSYEQLAEAMETTVPSVKSLLVRARVSLAEAAEARLLSCDEVRIELGEIAEGLRRRPTPLVRRHLRACKRCSSFRLQLRDTNRSLAALLPIGPLVVFKKILIGQVTHSAGAGSGATAAGSGATAAGSGATAAGALSATAGSTVLAGSTTTGIVSAGVSALATKAAAGLAAAALVTAGAVEVSRGTHSQAGAGAVASSHATLASRLTDATPLPAKPARLPLHVAKKALAARKPAKPAVAVKPAVAKAAAAPVTKPQDATAAPTHADAATTSAQPATPPPGRTETQDDPTVLSGSQQTPTTTSTTTVTTTSPTVTTPASPSDGIGTGTTTTSTPASTTTTPGSSTGGGGSTTATGSQDGSGSSTGSGEAAPPPTPVDAGQSDQSAPAAGTATGSWSPSSGS
jgi:RNA polymerase sigma factor (sigma-70 family)